ncbi:uncharacterized protein LOC119113696 [Pollicipes pollicipes]|uniref:uncharacterized protein LOC119113696 n=1 Tax=Pollicipes pollicipes TaxID=41117 RepID=UPI001884EA27|nr:uncharacterized protein LOC119113696 [Pollicipes pollicipes]
MDSFQTPAIGKPVEEWTPVEFCAAYMYCVGTFGLLFFFCLILCDGKSCCFFRRCFDCLFPEEKCEVTERGDSRHMPVPVCELEAARPPPAGRCRGPRDLPPPYLDVIAEEPPAYDSVCIEDDAKRSSVVDIV